ncbi:FtsX-like permease family protein [Wenzhouxiangella sp. XN201]|uniref:FtsX-like permease family protein n=1 Tax=Wenzhouxiangella sp. XN201 TaxID=2710755 RepID=UPI0013C6C7E2|nr:FtsX-like permease family protein [Wenzhouxiangella sp. XN201]NEZ04471.1 FtsX-like permease family protein [Wenzhouxiangella sp. XN201]
MMSGLIADLRHAFRVYRRTPWQSALAILMMAAAMALVAATATLWSDLYLSATPGVEDDRGLVTIGLRRDIPTGLFDHTALENFETVTQTLESVAAAALFGSFSNVDFEGEPLTQIAEPVRSGYFKTLRPRMHLGRAPTTAELEGEGDRVLVLSHDFWEEHLDADPGILQRELDLAGERWRVIGVADPDFTGLRGRTPAFWIPWRRFFAHVVPNFPENMIDRFAMWQVAGRSATGASPRAVEAEVNRFVADYDFSARLGSALRAGEVLVLPGLVARPQARQAAQRQVSLLLAASVLVATVAAVNIGIFLLARAPARRRELALRQTLGATRSRLARQLITEAGLLVFLATAVGMLLSIWLTALMRELAFLERAGFSDAVLNLPALAMAAGLAALFTVLVALVPIFMVRGRRLGQMGRQTSARPGPFQFAAGLIQLSLAGLVGAAALAFLAHVWMMERRDLGLSTEGVLVASVTFSEQPGGGYEHPGPEAVQAYREAVRERLEGIAGIERVSFGAPVPGQIMRASMSLDIEGRKMTARMINVDAGFFDLLDIRLLHGRGFEHHGEQGVVVSRTLAEQAWGEIDAIGRFIFRTDDPDTGQRGQVIGVVEDVHYDHPDRPHEPLLFSTHSGVVGVTGSILIEGSPDVDAIETAVNEILAARFDILHVHQVTALTEIVGELTAPDRARAMLTGLFGLVVVLMAGFGFFAMQRFLVDAGRRETAIRMALGAGPRLTRRHVLVQGLKLGLPGLVIGSLLALITAGWLSDDLISADVSVILIGTAVSITLLLLMLTASLQPAMRAARSQPGELLGED